MSIPTRQHRQIRHAHRVVTCGLTMLIAASCSSDEASGPASEPPVTAASTTSEAPTTDPPIETTTTVELQTTTTSTATPTTTDVPLETTTPLNPLSAEAAEAEVLRLYQMFTECLAAMPNCDPVEVSSNYSGGLQAVILRQTTEWAEGGFRIENAESRTIQIESSAVDVGAAGASVVSCEDNGAILIDSEDNVVDDLQESFRVQWLLTSDGTRWVLSDRGTLEAASGEGNSLCVD